MVAGKIAAQSVSDMFKSHNFTLQAMKAYGTSPFLFCLVVLFVFGSQWQFFCVQADTMGVHIFLLCSNDVQFHLLVLFTLLSLQSCAATTPLGMSFSLPVCVQE